ncbi:Pr6Pr family membrane protein [Microbacterium hominis]|nr:Pr6Pr family membrane protein [Microbacterium hominis]
MTALSGVLAGLIVNIDRAGRENQVLADVLANYFSMFTIVSTILAMAALIGAAEWSLRHPGTTPEPLSVALSLAATAGPVLLLGVVYNALLRGLPSTVALGDSAGIALLDAYGIEVLHVALPLYFVVDLLLAPRRRALPWWSLAVLVGYPLVWTAYTMIRGDLVANPDGSAPWWYPYPFLDPHGPGGYPSAFLYIGAILVAFLAIGAMIILVARYRAKRAFSHGGHAPTARPLSA